MTFRKSIVPFLRAMASEPIVTIPAVSERDAANAPHPPHDPPPLPPACPAYATARARAGPGGGGIRVPARPAAVRGCFTLRPRRLRVRHRLRLGRELLLQADRVRGQTAAPTTAAGRTGM